MNIAVIPFTAPGMSETEKNALTDVLRSELVSSRHFDVVERGQMDKLLAEQAIQATGCTTEECAVEIGKILNATHIVLGSISQLGRKYIISLRFVDVELGRIDTEVVKEQICELEDLSGMMREAARELLGKMLGEEPEPERLVSTQDRERLKRCLGVALEYPYAGLKINPHPAFSLEPRAAFGKDILIGGGRLYVNLFQGWHPVLFTAFEGDYVTFSARTMIQVRGFEAQATLEGFFLGWKS